MSDKTITISLTVAEINVILAALVEQPFKIASPLVGKITQEAQAQLATVEEE
jgi:hypothetical protein